MAFMAFMAFRKSLQNGTWLLEKAYKIGFGFIKSLKNWS